MAEQVGQNAGEATKGCVWGGLGWVGTGPVHKDGGKVEMGEDGFSCLTC